jgi:apolipoprotein D and lipocalin family protein
MTSMLSVFKRPLVSLLLAGSVAALSFVALPGFAKEAKPPLKTVTQLDMKTYAGRWYEIALIPYFGQNQCVRNAITDYTLLTPIVMKDHFECDKSDGTIFKLTGRLKSMRPDSNAVMSYTMINLFGWQYWLGENYWVIDLAEDYSYTVVGNPDRSYAWIMARKPVMDKAILEGIAQRLTAQGYDACKLRMSPQTSDPKAAHSTMSLCDYIKP